MIVRDAPGCRLNNVAPSTYEGIERIDSQVAAGVARAGRVRSAPGDVLGKLIDPQRDSKMLANVSHVARLH